MDLQKKIAQLPLASGVYLMKNAAAEVLYVGKAVSLRSRVQSYFRKSQGERSKTDFLVSEIRDIAYIPTASEAEALILEASLIKEYQPKYNIELRDDKSYPYIQVTAGPFPLISVVRPASGKKGHSAVSSGAGTVKYYGPYVNARLIREALTIIRKIFHFRSCDPIPKKECLDHHLGLCDAPCIQRISAVDYQKIVRNVCLILEGKKDELTRALRLEMEKLSRAKRFEEASRVRDQMRALGALYSGTTQINYYKEAEQLERILGLSRRPERIEAFDISNIMGSSAVGAMVSFLNGKPDKSQYRRFRIRDINGIDDFRMMAQVVQRRYARLKREGRLFPDLIVVDGGKGQLSAAKEELKKLEVDIPVIALAKRDEEIFLPSRRNPIVLAKDALALQLLQRVRDEVHRFAVSYHRLLRTKTSLGRGSHRIKPELGDDI